MSTITPLTVIKGSYLAPLDQVDAHRDAHIAFLKDLVADGRVILGGRRNPPDGSILVFRGDDSDAVLTAMAQRSVRPRRGGRLRARRCLDAGHPRAGAGGVPELSGPSKAGRKPGWQKVAGGVGLRAWLGGRLSDARSLLFALVVVCVSGAVSSASAAQSRGYLSGPFTKKTVKVFTHDLAKVGIGVYRPGVRQAQVRVRGRVSPVRLTPDTARAAATGAWSGAGISGAQLNAIMGPARVSGQFSLPVGAIVAGWAKRARSPSARFAQRTSERRTGSTTSRWCSRTRCCCSTPPTRRSI